MTKKSLTPIPSASKDLVDFNIRQIKALFPNVFSEGKIDFDALKNELGDNCNTGGGSGERYQFTWAGKEQAKRIATTPSLGTLRPAPDESLDWESTENLYIEGDNLEVLKLLQKSYFNQVKMIYIDPPYNTGKDFVYKDNFRDNLANYQRLTGQRDAEDNPLTTNSDSDGRYHSNWLNMMYPRLKLARNLLTDDGVIFISIDDNEQANLKKICDEVFGEENFVGEIIWESTTQPINSGSARFNLQKNTEYILLYGKTKKNINGFNLEQLESDLSYPHDGKFGKCRFEIIEKSDAGGYSRPTMKFSILGKEPRKGKRWQIGQETARQLELEGKLEVVDGVVKRAIYPEDEVDKQKFAPFWALLVAEKYGTAQKGKDLLNTLMDQAIGFDTVKPVELIKYLLSLMYYEDDIVLDFFSGSATTAHAVMQLNAEDGGNRRFIMIQLPEQTEVNSNAYQAGYPTICEIGKERIRRAATKIRNEYPETDIDLGFKVFKLDTSNLKKWQPDSGNLEKDLLDAIDNILPDRSNQDLLYEVLIKYGLPLTYPVEEIKIADHTIFNVANGSIIACFDEGIDLETVQAIAALSTEEQPVLRVVFRDTSFVDDIVKTNAIQRLLQAGIEDVLSI